VKITAPGVPDFYQGTELWDLSLVDPDNRRPVDFELRRQLLEGLVAEIDSAHDLASLARYLVKTKDDGRIKLRGPEAAVVVVPRLLARRGIDDPPLGAGYWGTETAVVAPAAVGTAFRNVLTGERVSGEDGRLALERLFTNFPLALLIREA
jgi:(1->4)-alpha-D-glucan 1-alpha-D-glucosylmutase